MCGIFGVCGIDNPSDYRGKCLECAKAIRHRGSDWSGIYQGQDFIVAHERCVFDSSF